MTKYVNNNGVSEMWLNIKNWVTSQLLGYSQTGHTHSASDITSGLSTVATSGDYADLTNKPTIPTVNNATLTIQKNGTTVKTFTANASSNVTANITVPTKTSDLTNDSGFLTSHQDLSGYIPRSGGAVITGDEFAQTTTNSRIVFRGGTSFETGGTIYAHGKDYSLKAGYAGLIARTSANTSYAELDPAGKLMLTADSFEIVKNNSNGGLRLSGGYSYNTGGGGLALHGKNRPNSPSAVVIFSHSDGGTDKLMWFQPDGTWTWNGTAVQITSDARLKQQISEIDDKLLDAWEDVNLVQFKYNDAVDQKKDKARLHTGYVVQQIDKACQSHGVDISEYGLYCHEGYPQETEEVEVEQADGTKVKETKVIREANEHYSLRYTECLVVECAYLRKKNKELQEQFDKLSARLDKLEGVQTK